MDQRPLLPPHLFDYSLSIVKREPVEEVVSCPVTNLETDSKRPKSYDNTGALSRFRPRNQRRPLPQNILGNRRNQISSFTRSFGQCQPQVQPFLPSPLTQFDLSNRIVTQSQTHEPIDRQQPELGKPTEFRPLLHKSETDKAFDFWRPWIFDELKPSKETLDQQTEPEVQLPELYKPTEPQIPKPIKKETETENAIQYVFKAKEALNLNLKRKSSKAIETEGPRVKMSCKLEHYKVFCTIPGRLSLLTNAKHDVTVGELARRVSEPECLNVSLINGLVRTAKKKGGTVEFRDKLDQVGINIPSGRQINCPQTSFTALVESEATQLASDFGTIVENEFPTEECAQTLAESDDSDQMMKDAGKFLEYFSSFLKDEKKMHNLEMLTHNFCVPAIMATVELMQDVIKEGLNTINHKDLGQWRY